jgi:hypothetical protein
MKTKVLIIEDDVCKFFATKQVLESQLKLPVHVVDVRTSKELAEAAVDLDPDLVIFRPVGGIAELLDRMRKRKTNRRNTQITLLVASEFDDESARRLGEFLSKHPKKLANAA